MRGGLTANEAYQIDVGDRDIINEIIKDNLDTTKESGLNFF